jgi:hypothetical protein
MKRSGRSAVPVIWALSDRRRSSRSMFRSAIGSTSSRWIEAGLDRVSHRPERLQRMTRSRSHQIFFGCDKTALRSFEWNRIVSSITNFARFCHEAPAPSLVRSPQKRQDILNHLLRRSIAMRISQLPGPKNERIPLAVMRSNAKAISGPAAGPYVDDEVRDLAEGNLGDSEICNGASSTRREENHSETVSVMNRPISCLKIARYGLNRGFIAQGSESTSRCN